jgi:hypothetical protein
MVGLERIMRLAVATLAVVVAAAIKPPLNVPAWDWDPPYIEFCLTVSECEASAVMRCICLSIRTREKRTISYRGVGLKRVCVTERVSSRVRGRCAWVVCVVFGAQIALMSQPSNAYVLPLPLPSLSLTAYSVLRCAVPEST